MIIQETMIMFLTNYFQNLKNWTDKIKLYNNTHSITNDIINLYFKIY